MITGLLRFVARVRLRRHGWLPALRGDGLHLLGGEATAALQAAEIAFVGIEQQVAAAARARAQHQFLFGLQRFLLCALL